MSTIVYFKAFLTQGLKLNPVLAEFSVFGMDITIRWYGVIIAFGFTLAVLFGGRMAYKWKMSLDKMLDVLIFGTLAGILGARLFYVLFSWEYYAQHPGEILQIWNGGLAIYGGLIGGVLAAVVVCKVRKLNLFNLLDMAGMSFLIGQGIGRWGNFVNQEAFGSNTTLPWGMKSAATTAHLLQNQAMLLEKGVEVDPYGYVHPTFLYESLWCLLGFLVLYLICRKWRKFSGQIFLCYGIWYGIGRTFLEGLRTDSLYIGTSSIRVSQLLSALLVLVCAALLVFFLQKYKKNPKPIEGVDYFTDEFIRKKDSAEKPADTQAEIAQDAVETAPDQQKKPKQANEEPDTKEASDAADTSQ